MNPRIVAAVVALSCGCGHSYTALSYDVSHRSHGSMNAMSAEADRHSGTLAFGYGGIGAAMELAVHVQDAEVAVDPWLAASAGLELKLSPLHHGPAALFLHGGPMRAAVVDSKTGDVTWGVGLSYGAGVMLGTHGLHGFVDVRAEDTFYAGAAMTATDGSTAVRTISLGVLFGN